MASPKTRGSKVIEGTNDVHRERTPFGYESGERSGSGGVSFFGGSLKNENGNNPVDKGHSKPTL